MSGSGMGMGGGAASPSASFSNWFDKQRRDDGATAPRAGSLGGGMFSGMFGGSGGGDGGGRDVESDTTTESSTFLPSFVRNPFASSPAAPAVSEWTCGLSTAVRWQIAILLLLGSAALFFLSLFVFLPLVLLVPAKFASSITFASLFFMTAMACIRGPRTTVMGFLDRDRLAFTAAYLASLALTLYATLVSHSYFLIVAALSVQVGALLWYAASFVPGGTAGMGMVSRLFMSSATTTMRGVGSLVMGRG